jgi:hypothetical protein
MGRHDVQLSKVVFGLGLLAQSTCINSNTRTIVHGIMLQHFVSPTNIIVEKQKNLTYLIKARSAEYKARCGIVLLVTSVINPGCDIVVDHNCFNQPGR